ncbi:MAG: hypothetical protein ACOYJY_04855 [Acutalibacteraceae bacterium]|jgi:hypothetical protein
MKHLVCEMCGASDLMKQDGVFVCQFCGAKYSVEDAKKMMIDGTVEVAGTVKVDVSEKLKNLYVMARRAKDDNNPELASKYYEMITFENPDDWEAVFYYNLLKVRQGNLLDMKLLIVRLSNSLKSVFDVIDRSEKSADEKWNIAEEIIREIDSICADALYLAKAHYINFRTTDNGAYDERVSAVANLQKRMADLLEKYFENYATQNVVAYLKSYVQNYTQNKIFDSITRKHYEKDIKELTEAEDRIERIEPNYTRLVVIDEKQTDEKQTGGNAAPMPWWQSKGVKVGGFIGFIIGIIFLVWAFSTAVHLSGGDVVAIIVVGLGGPTFLGVGIGSGFRDKKDRSNNPPSDGDKTE